MSASGVYDFDPERLVKHQSPISPKLYGELSLFCMLLGFVLLAL